MPWPAALAGVAVAAVGVAGLIRGAVPLPAGASVGAPNPSPPIVVSGAYVRAPVPPTDAAAAYFTVFNTTNQPDKLTTVISGAGQLSVLHATVHGQMQVVRGGVVIPAHGKLVFQTGGGHVMIEKLIGKVTAGQTVNLALTFQKAGVIEVIAPVIAVGAPAPTDGSSGSPSPAATVGATSGASR